MKSEAVVDTNVPVVANGDAPQAGYDCVSACMGRLRQIIDEEILLLDDKDLILREYRNNLSLSGQPGRGDEFLYWLWFNQANPQSCRIIPITPDIDRGFAEFPADPALATFDPGDRKFVAVAIASGSAPQILNATDTDWWNHLEALQRHGVYVTFLCPELMQ